MMIYLFETKCTWTNSIKVYYTQVYHITHFLHYERVFTIFNTVSVTRANAHDTATCLILFPFQSQPRLTIIFSMSQPFFYLDHFASFNTTETKRSLLRIHCAF